MSQVELHCVHRHYLNNNVHKLILQDETSHAVDDALMHLDRILEEHPVDETLCLFIDARVGVPPLNYFFSELRKVYGAREELPPIRAVYIYEKSIMLSILQAFFNALGTNASRCFIRGGTDVEALEWLTGDT